jgi:hypothetical protein
MLFGAAVTAELVNDRRLGELGLECEAFGLTAFALLEDGLDRS